MVKLFGNDNVRDPNLDEEEITEDVPFHKQSYDNKKHSLKNSP